jgi:hypothetical protein
MNHTPPNPSVLGLHELEFGVSVVPLFLISAALICLYRSRQIPKHLVPCLGLVVIMIIPILGTFGNESWGRVLLHIPIINNNTTLTRWWSIYTITFITLAALAFDRVFVGSRVRGFSFMLCVIAASLQLMLRDLTYYSSGVGWGLYNPEPIRIAIRQVLVNGDSLPDITKVGQLPLQNPSSFNGRNDALVEGVSALPCYEPLFGYNLEFFPARGLQDGSLDLQTDGHYNMADPRCYLRTRATKCRPGQQFRIEDRADMIEFASHQALRWQMPLWGLAAEKVTVVSFSLSVLVLTICGLLHLIRTPPRKLILPYGRENSDD